MHESPVSEDEKPVAVTLFGRNEAKLVNINGWTHDFPINFVDLDETLKIKSHSFNERASADEDRVSKYWKEIRDRPRTTLAVIESGAWPLTAHKIVQPLELIVLAKKKIDYLVKANNCLMFGSLLVADEEGNCCTLNLCNATISCLYDQVSPGDSILLTAGTYARSDNSYCNFPFRNELLLNIVIKVSSFQCRHVYRIIGDTPSFAFPARITEGRKLWTPSELITIDGDINQCFGQDAPCADVIGVVSHVGRLERLCRYSCDVQVGDGKTTEVLPDFPQYNVFRWIELVDETVATPLPVKIYVNKNTWDTQKQIIPGSLLVVSLTEKVETMFGYDHLQTSRFSSIYANESIAAFMRLMPESHKTVVAKLLGSAPLRILGRQDISWSVGGSYAQPFKSPQNFLNFVHERRDTTERKVGLFTVPSLPMERRQVQFLFFKAQLLKYRPVSPEATFGAGWANTDLLKRHPYVPSPIMCSLFAHNTEVLWYLFTRKLPNLEYPSKKKGTDGRTHNYQFAANAYAKYCGPLLMPAQDDGSLRRLPAIDGDPHYVLDILNLEATDPGLNRYNAVWKPSRHLRFEQMTERLNASKGKPVMVLMEVHRIESIGIPYNRGFELLVQDFSAVELDVDPMKLRLEDSEDPAETRPGENMD